MEWSDWKNRYLDILERLKIKQKDDEASAKLLEQHLESFMIISRSRIHQELVKIFKRPIIVAGAGPSLESDLIQIKKLEMQKFAHIITADGATTAFRLNNIIPKVVVTDLDGELKSIFWALRKRALILIHAHGDNPHLISMFFRKYGSKLYNAMLWGTSQSDPGKTLFNFGGFTDGDRAIFLGFHFQAPLIGLVGFDFGTKIGKFSTYKTELLNKDLNQKITKLNIAIDLLTEFYPKHNGLRYNLTSSGFSVPGFPNISFKDFHQKVFEYKMSHDI